MMLKEMMKKEIQTKRNPECGNLEIQFCYETKSGADAVNHLLLVNTSRRRIQRWPMMLCFNALDFTDWNAEMSHSRTPLLMECGKTFVDIRLDKPVASAPQSLPYTVRKTIESMGAVTTTVRSTARKNGNTIPKNQRSATG
ncbi:hypothetical protein Tsp_10213 [Trichinella spiralis]|uniref:hypothetical protein n=1 Tax=Trichinella spiralis TaxID=6334 RepID=UPI0001EFDDF0|nr:hypothetical protein Tsp_10213 [Trichinella spiralis]